jgi:hypothetical protein
MEVKRDLKECLPHPPFGGDFTKFSANACNSTKACYAIAHEQLHVTPPFQQQPRANDVRWYGDVLYGEHRLPPGCVTRSGDRFRQTMPLKSQPIQVGSFCFWWHVFIFGNAKEKVEG